MREKVQNVIFPQNDKLEEHFALYYRGGNYVLTEHDNGQKKLMLPKYTYSSFCTYFNGLSYSLWKKYTGMNNLVLRLDIAGQFELIICGYSLNLGEPVKTRLAEYNYNLDTRSTVEVNIESNDEQMIGFELKTLSECVLYGGCYIGEFDKIREINLAISTTTCRKEEYITHNVKMLKECLLDCTKAVNGDNNVVSHGTTEGSCVFSCNSADIENSIDAKGKSNIHTDIAGHLFINIVDNGNTLTEADFPEHEHIKLFHNHNSGGSGGFARGMIEALHQKDNITHVLLMDDDVMVQPEAIYKTYVLLKHLKSEYQRYFISGAMLYMERVWMQKEDVGVLNKDGYFVPLKPEFNQEFVINNLCNELDYPISDHCYAAWWYCCIPLDTIREKGLPLPICVRGDDVEYGLRCAPGFITMNGICVWHMGFAGKFNVGMDHYQVNRNLLINQACTGLIDDVNVIRKLSTDYRFHILRLDYDSAEIVVRALEDYVKGPDIIREDNGETILKANNKLGHSMTSLRDMGDPHAGLGDPYVEPYIRIDKRVLGKLVYNITDNGHKFRFLCRFDDKVNIIPYNAVWTPFRTAFRNKLIAVNPVARNCYVLTRNQSRYNELTKRFKAAMRYYNANKDSLIAAYRKAYSEFKTEEFWRRYLELE